MSEQSSNDLSIYCIINHYLYNSEFYNMLGCFDFSKRFSNGCIHTRRRLSCLARGERVVSYLRPWNTASYPSQRTSSKWRRWCLRAVNFQGNMTSYFTYGSSRAISSSRDRPDAVSDSEECMSSASLSHEEEPGFFGGMRTFGTRWMTPSLTGMLGTATLTIKLTKIRANP
jgi:hypothetical protein